MAKIPDVDIEKIGRRINEENRREDKLLQARREEAQREAQRLAGKLREAQGDIRKIWGFGSTFDTSRPFRWDSDIDLALEGGDIITLYSLVLDSPFKVDLIDISGQEDVFAQGIRKKGVAL